jgi:uncharacterized protein DUF4873
MSDEGYAGPAALAAAGADLTVQVRLSGRVEPLDGRYHWAGRIAAQVDVTRLFRDGVRSATLRIDNQDPVEVRLSEVDPWGAVRVSATSAPPWPPVDSVDPSGEGE